MNEQIIITLTTYKARLNIVQKTLNSLLNGSMQPDKYVINLSTDEFPNKEQELGNLPDFCKQHNIEIYWIKENSKPYKKLIPTLKRFPNDIIVSVDDDIDYPKDFLETLVNDWNKSNKKHPITAGNYLWHHKIWTHHGSFTLCKYEHFGQRIFELYEGFALPHLNDLGTIDDQMFTYAALINNVLYIPSSKLLERYKWSHTFVRFRDKESITTNNIGHIIAKYDDAIRQYIWDNYGINTDELIKKLPNITNVPNVMYGTARFGGIDTSYTRVKQIEEKPTELPKHIPSKIKINIDESKQQLPVKIINNKPQHKPINTVNLQETRNKMSNILSAVQLRRLMRR